MHPWRPWTGLVILAAFAAQAASVYKWTDADGVIHYSDQPAPGAEKIQTSTSLGTPAAVPARPAAESAATGVEKQGPLLGYTQFSVTTPAPDQTFFGDEVISVNLALDPPLKSNHALTWHLNGRQIDDPGPNQTQFNLPHQDRGTYAIAATVTDPRTGESRSTESVTFYVRQPSALSPQHQKP